jgi:hypothetical protein
MKLTRLFVFSSGLVIGYLAGTAAGRERYDQMTDTAAGLASDIGLKNLGDRLAQRSGDVARATTHAATDFVDATADKVADTVGSTEHPEPKTSSKAH